jgi:tRNA nucleotidyltransferase/poly(A) polymerase
VEAASNWLNVNTLLDEPFFGELRAALQSFPTNIYLGGGAVRDLLLGFNAVSGDYDLFAEGQKTSTAPLREKVFELATKHKKVLCYDLILTNNPRKYVETFDFSIHSFLLDIKTLELSGAERAFEDLKKRRLNYNSHATFVTNPAAFIRAFRLSQECQLSMSEEVVAAIVEYGHALALLDPSRFTAVFLEFVRLLTVSFEPENLKRIAAHGLLKHLLPFRIYCERSTLQRFHFSQLFAELMRSSENLVLSNNRKAYGFSKSGKRFELHFSDASIFRLALMCSGVGSSLLKDAKGSEERYSSRILSAFFGKLILDANSALIFKSVIGLSLELERYLMGKPHNLKQNPIGPSILD